MSWIFVPKLLNWCESIIEDSSFAKPLDIGLPRTVDMLTFWLVNIDPLLDESDHNALKFLHRFRPKILSLDETVNLISELVFRVPDILLLNHVQIERTDLLYTKKSLPQELRPKWSHSHERFRFVAFIIHKVAHPFVYCCHVWRPLEFRELC